MNNKNIKILFSVLFLNLTLFYSCTTTQVQKKIIEFNEDHYIPEEYDWKEIEPGLEYAFFENKFLPLRYHLVKINLKNKNLEICAYPNQLCKMNNENQTKLKSAKNISKELNCDILINTSPFSYINLFNADIVGFHKIKNKIFSDANQKYSALAFKKENDYLIPYIIKNQNNNDSNNYDYIFGGFFTILENKKEIDFSYHSQDSRTAIGFTEDKSTLYILCVEGEKKNKSQGLSYNQCAKIFLKNKCSHALEFDGGSSTQLNIKNKNYCDYIIYQKQAAFLGFRIKKY